MTTDKFDAMKRIVTIAQNQENRSYREQDEMEALLKQFPMLEFREQTTQPVATDNDLVNVDRMWGGNADPMASALQRVLHDARIARHFLTAR